MWLMVVIIVILFVLNFCKVLIWVNFILLIVISGFVMFVFCRVWINVIFSVGFGFFFDCVGKIGLILK